MFKRLLSLSFATAASFASVALAALPATADTPSFEVVTRDQVTLQPLNPLRGDASPRAAVLWGDIKQNIATGSLVSFVDGFSSPPHIHNITYRAVVIQGEVHNDDPAAANMWMVPGSFWTQPAGETHITSAQGDNTTIFLEIASGPYLVRPSREEFDNGERPVNVHADNIFWVDAHQVGWLGLDQHGPEVAFLWGSVDDGQDNGTFLRLPAGFNGHLTGNGNQIRTVVIKGSVDHQIDGHTDTQSLAPGSYVGSTGALTHAVSCASDSSCLLYVRTVGAYSFGTGT